MSKWYVEHALSGLAGQAKTLVSSIAQAGPASTLAVLADAPESPPVRACISGSKELMCWTRGSQALQITAVLRAENL